MNKVLNNTSFKLTAVLLVISLLFLPSTLVSAAATHLVISQVQIAGTTTTDDFVEIYNPTSSPVDLNGHRIVKRTAAGTTDTSLKSFSSETIVPAFGYYLWANSAWTPSVSPDSSTSGTLANDNGVALRLGAEDTGQIVDSVSWGSSTNVFVEGTVFPTNPAAGSSIQRKVDESTGHGLDTDNNSTDFEILETSSPRNSTFIIVTPTPTPTATPSPTPSPTSTPTATPTPTPSPTPSPTPTVTPTPSPSPEPSVTPTPTPTATPSPTPTSSPTPTVTPSPTPTGTPQSGAVIGVFNFPNARIECRVNFITFRSGWFFAVFPSFVCSRV